MTTAPAKNSDTQNLDELTGGAFSAATSGERAARVREWLGTDPTPEQMQEVFKELSVKDKGAVKPLRQKLDEIKRTRVQELMAAEWALKAQVLLDTTKLNVADAMAWQRDAAKAGAPLSKEPLSHLKAQLADRIKVIEDLQHRVQVQREAAVLLAQRVEVLSTKPWRDAQAVWDALRSDIEHWQSQATGLLSDTNWASVDAKFPPLLDASRTQLLVVWDAFDSALAIAVAAAVDPAAVLPPVPVWADELRVLRGVPAEAAPAPKKPRIDPEIRLKATEAVREVLSKLELEIAEGHGKASAGAAAALRNALKEFGRNIDDKLESQAHAALAAAGELEGWQRWRADQLREALVTKAEGLLKRPEGQALGGRKIQEALRSLREQWKLTDQGGVPNHALWKRFDEACNEAYKVVETWLEKIKAESAENRATRLALIEELKTWAADNRTAKDNDWKGFHRVLLQFGDRWRDSGHMGEKALAELQPLWRSAIDEAAAPLVALQQQSLLNRQAMIAEAQALGAESVLHIDGVRVLQQRWQAEAHQIPIDRRQEQKLWDAFRKPIDEAFNRKTAEREKAQAAVSGRDREVMQAAKALQAANASADMPAIRAAMAALEAALSAQSPAADDSRANVSAADASAPDNSGAGEAPLVEAVQEEATKPVAVVPRKPVLAVRGDDRPGMKKAEPAPTGRGGRPVQRPHERSQERSNDRSGERAGARAGARPAGRDNAPGFGRGVTAGKELPRLGEAAFRAQRDAMEQAQLALRKLAAQSHGESLTQLLHAWEQRNTADVPTQQALGSRVTAALRTVWMQAIGAAPTGEAAESLLRLEMASELPTPAAHLEARRALQLKLLTRRNDPPPVQTWGQDVARVLAAAADADTTRRLQAVLRVLLRG